MKALTGIVVLVGVAGALAALRGSLHSAGETAPAEPDAPCPHRAVSAVAPPAAKEPIAPRSPPALPPPGKLLIDPDAERPAPVREVEPIMVAPDGSPIRRLPSSDD